MESPSASAGDGLCRRCGKPLADRSATGICAACQFPPDKKNRLPSTEDLDAALPRFKIGSCVGRGSMGCVFKAYDKDLERYVAIKAIPKSPDNPELIDRFQLEYRSMAGLDHVNIPVIYDHGETGSFRYYVLEWMKDGCLAKLRPHLSVDLTIHYGRQVCLALEYAHTRRIIHRDIKPSNVLISGRSAKLADFGLTKRLDDDLTNHRESVGTPGFMSPEQNHGDPTTDERADVFGLAALIYYLLTGIIPEGRIRRPHHFGVPECFDDVLLKSLEPDRTSRHQTVQDFRVELEQALQDFETPPRRWWSRWIGMAGPS